MTACLFRSGSNYYSLGNQRHYDAWGQIRNGLISGDPKGRYCASLGHKQDDESGLVYMRARYYEPAIGRWLSQDPGADGHNWFSYCKDDPIGRVDNSGRDDWSSTSKGWFSIYAEAGLCCFYLALAVAFPKPANLLLAAVLCVAAANFFACAFNDGPTGSQDIKECLTIGTALGGLAASVAMVLFPAKSNAITCATVILFGIEDLVLIGVLADIQLSQ